MTYRDKLHTSAAKAGSLFCLGIDPILDRFPLELRTRGTRFDIAGITAIVETALDALDASGLRPAAFKPNIGYFVACDRPRESDRSPLERFAGSQALAELLSLLRSRMPDVPIILDGKRGDIARSSLNYAFEAFDVWGVDALTVSPWMGEDSVAPFLDAARTAGGGVYVLARTSNPGGAQFQNRLADGAPMYRHVAVAVALWRDGSAASDGVAGAVVGATAPRELEEIAGSLASAPIPLLIPGIGGQGGSAGVVLETLQGVGYPLPLVRVNASGAALFPWTADPDETRRAHSDPEYDWKGAVGEAVRALHGSLSFTSVTRPGRPSRGDGKASPSGGRSSRAGGRP